MASDKLQDKTNKPTGRPQTLATRQKISIGQTKFKKEYLIDKAHEYIQLIAEQPEDRKTFPSVVGYCLHAGISKSRFYELANQISDLSDVLQYINMLQEASALDQQSSFSQFLLKSKHGYNDQPQALTQNNTFNISPDLLADALKLMRAK